MMLLFRQLCSLLLGSGPMAALLPGFVTVYAFEACVLLQSHQDPSMQSPCRIEKSSLTLHSGTATITGEDEGNTALTLTLIPVLLCMQMFNLFLPDGDAAPGSSVVMAASYI